MPHIQLIDFIPHHPQHRAMFDALNREWLEEYGFLEPTDEAMLANPEAQILDKGGAIIFALHDERYIGTGTLLHCEEGVVEIGKLAVTAPYRGKRIGRQLAEALVEAARSRGAKTIRLASNRKLTTALALYRKLGFTETTCSTDPRYASCDVTMRLDV